jgi:hypothetical protein
MAGGRAHRTPLVPRRPSGCSVRRRATAVEIEGVFASKGIDDDAFYTAELDDLIAAAER